MAKYSGTGTIANSDYKSIKWVGKSKDGKAVTITLKNAINMGNIDWAFKDKDDTVAQIVFTATYDNTDEAATSTDEPWEVEINGQTAGAGEIILGSGVFYIEETKVGLSRGGGSFNVAREYRQIEADGDRGPVKGRIDIISSVATLTMNVLTILTRVADLYAGIKTTE